MLDCLTKEWKTDFSVVLNSVWYFVYLVTTPASSIQVNETWLDVSVLVDLWCEWTDSSNRTLAPAIRWVLSLFGDACVWEGWNNVLHVKARDLTAPAKTMRTAGKYWALFPVTATLLYLIAMYKLLLQQKLILCWCDALSCLKTTPLQCLQPFPAILPCFSCNIALLQLQPCTSALGAATYVRTHLASGLCSPGRGQILLTSVHL